MEEKILTILLDMQVDIKDLKKRVINIEENEIPSMKASIKNIEENEIFTANDLATSLNLSRNTVSQYLNEGSKDESIVKVNSRPVYFFDKTALIKKWNVRIMGNEFASFDLLMAQKEHVKRLCAIQTTVYLL